MDPAALLDMSAAVVVGSGRTVWEDLRARGAEPAVIFAVNDMITLATDLEVRHGVSHHQDKLAHWLRLRATRGGRPSNITLHSSAAHDGVHRVWPEYRSGGSSSLLAVRIARALGHDHVVVAGVPLDARGYVWADPTHQAKDFGRYRQAWIDARAELRGHVFAPSGFLRELLGWPYEDPADVARMNQG